MWYIYTKEHYSAMKNEIMAFAAIQTDLEITYYLLSIISEKGPSFDIIHKWDLILKMIHTNLFKLIDTENKLMVTKGEM